MKIGRAVKCLKGGERIARAGWKGMYLYYVPEYQIPQFSGPNKNFDAYIMMVTATGSRIPWLCSQADLLADDFTIVK